MGYSIFIIAKNKQVQQGMYEFLGKNLIGFNQHFNGSDQMYYATRIGSKGGNSISYTGGMNNSFIIGFDFNTGGGDRTHMFEILKWMGRTIGKNPDIYYYDGELSDMNDEEGLDGDVNELPFKLGIIKTKYKKTGKPYPHDYVEDGKKSDDEINAEVKEKKDFIEGDIKRLDTLWNDSIYFEVK